MNSVELSTNDTMRRIISALCSHMRILLFRILLIVMLDALAGAALLTALALNTSLSWVLLLSLIVGLVALFSAATSRLPGRYL